MDIRLLEPNKPYYRDCRNHLMALLHRAPASEARVCPGCHVRCETCGGTSCTCNCSPDCPEAPTQLSSDPQNHPIEPNILPMVFALYSLRLCEPCWSCEGHSDGSGQLYRPPRAWFFARSIVFPDLIASCLAQLHSDRKLNHPWTVNVVCWDQESPDSTFSIEPKFAPGDQPTLDRLRRDARTIADALPDLIDAHAHRRLARLDVALSGVPTR